MAYVSFDIFDTCLIRKCGNANNVFFLLGRILFGIDSTQAEMFYHWRVWAESEAIRRTNRKAVTIAEIYDTLRPEIRGEYTTEEIIEAEMNLASEQLRLLPSTLKLITEYRNQGYGVVFISDMYLPSSFLRELLLREGIWKESDALFVSCECGYTKSTSDLYMHVARKKGSKPLYHYGDTPWSDIKMAKKVGINPILIHSDFNKTEKYVLSKTKYLKQALAFSCIVGVMRFSRLTSTLGFAADMSADFVAPIWTAYVFDILQKAKRDNIERLYFLARDGYILLWIAKQLHEMCPNLELRYLYVSRKSMYLPSFTGCSLEDTEPYFGDKFLYTSKEQVLRYFKQDKEWFPDKVRFEAIEARKRIDEYFEKEGIYEQNVNYALVDVGWKGSGRIAFNSLMHLHNCKHREMWYWGTFESWRNNFSGSFYTYNTQLRLPLYYITLIEDYFSTSPDLSTIDYEDGKPIFDEDSRIDNSDILELNKYCLQLYLDFLKEYHLENNDIHNTLSAICSSILINHPEFIDFSALIKMKGFCEEKKAGSGFVKRVGIIYALKYILGLNLPGGWSEGNIVYSYPKFFIYMRCCRHVSLSVKRLLKKIYNIVH